MRAGKKMLQQGQAFKNALAKHIRKRRRIDNQEEVGAGVGEESEEDHDHELGAAALERVV